MNAYQDFVAARPIIDPLEPDELDAIWAQVVGELTSGSPATAETSPAMRLAVQPSGMTRARLGGVPSHHSVSRRRPVVLVAAAACVVLLVVLIAAVVRPDGSAQLDETPPSTPASSWSALADPPVEPRSQAALVATDDGIFMWGGGVSAGSITDGAYYDSETATWRVLPDSTIAGDAGYGIAVWTGTEVLVLSSDTPAQAAAFDPEAFSWRPLPSPSGTGASGVSSLVSLGDAIVLVDRSTVELFDLATQTWSAPLDIADVGPTSAPVRSILADATASDALVALATRPLTPCAPAVVHILDTSTQIAEDVTLPDDDWWPSDLIGIGDGRFLAFGASGCGENAPVPDPRAYVIDATGAAQVEVAAPPSASGGAAPPPTIWTGDAVVGLTAGGELMSYRPQVDAWAVGDPLPDVVNGAEGRQLDATPIVWFDDRVFLVSPSFVTDVAGGQVCCAPVAGAWSSPLPE